jgi:protein-L-isoaspartate O-methyltransferase
LLDIGGNTGFFSAYLSRFVKKVDIVEYNKNYVSICKRLLSYEKINNITVFNESFVTFSSKYKYDIILSLAIHKWINMNFEDYLKKISYLLKKNGLLLLESHDVRNLSEKKLLKNLKNNNYFDIVFYDQVDDQNGIIRDFYWLKKKQDKNL